MTRACGEYFAVHREREPRPFLLDVLRRWPTGQGRLAVDLGCGPGSEALAMLEHGWRVLALDAQPEAIDILRGRVPPELLNRLETIVAPMHEVELAHADLVHAGFSLPFCPRPEFAIVWRSITRWLMAARSPANSSAIATWRNSPDMAFLAEAEVRALLDGWAVEVLDEVDEDGTAVSGPKHWHLWHVVARREGPASLAVDS